MGARGRRRGDRGAGGAVGARSQPPAPHLTSPLKGGRDEFSWGSGFGALRWAGSCPPPNRHSCHPHPSCPRPPLPSFLRRQEPRTPTPSNRATISRRTKVRPMPTSPPTTQAITPSTTIHPEHTLNNPEQIRTNLNKPEHRQTPRPDRTTPKITQNPPDQKNPEQARALRHSCAPSPSFLRRQEPAPLSRHSCAGRNPRLSHRHSRAPQPSFLRRQEPEQIRTNLNKPEHRQTPRPDRTTQKITQNPPDQKNPNMPAPLPQPSLLRLSHRRSCASPTVIPAQAGTTVGAQVPACAGMTERGRRNDGSEGALANFLAWRGAGGARRRRATPAALWRSESRWRARPPAQSATRRGTMGCPHRGRR